MKTNNHHTAVYFSGTVNTNSYADNRQFAKEQRRNMTAAEQKLWAYLRANRMNGLHFRRQHVLYGYLVDFYCHKATLAIEIYNDDMPSELNKRQDAVLFANGIRILRISSERVENELAIVLREIRTMLAPLI